MTLSQGSAWFDWDNVAHLIELTCVFILLLGWRKLNILSRFRRITEAPVGLRSADRVQYFSARVFCCCEGSLCRRSRRYCRFTTFQTGVYGNVDEVYRFRSERVKLKQNVRCSKASQNDNELAARNSNGSAHTYKMLMLCWALCIDIEFTTLLLPRKILLGNSTTQYIRNRFEGNGGSTC